MVSISAIPYHANIARNSSSGMGTTSQAPIAVGKTTFSTSPSLFLSFDTAFSSTRIATGGVRSKPSAVSTFTIRSQSACVSAPSRAAPPHRI